MTEIRGLDIHFPRIAVQDAQEGIRQIQEMVRRADEHHFTWTSLEPWVDDVASALFGERAQLPWSRND